MYGAAVYPTTLLKTTAAGKIGLIHMVYPQPNDRFPYELLGIGVSPNPISGPMPAVVLIDLFKCQYKQVERLI